MNTIILHGTCPKAEYYSDKFPSLSNSHWLPWLQKQLLIKGIGAHTPEVQDAYKPNYSKWQEEFERYPANQDTILVGHSCGGGFLTRWLSENKLAAKRVVLVAPWLDPNRVQTTDFFNFEIDPRLADRSDMHILISKDDDEDILESTATIQSKLSKVNTLEFEKHGHFTFNDMGTDKFPELLDLVLQK